MDKQKACSMDKQEACSMDRDMQHVEGHAVGTGVCSMDLDRRHEHRQGVDIDYSIGPAQTVVDLIFQSFCGRACRS